MGNPEAAEHAVRPVVGAPRQGARLSPSGLAWASLLLATVAGLAAIPVAFGGRPVRPLGTDMFAYVWQTRVVDHAAFTALGSRPGVPVLGAFFADLQVMDRVTAPLVLANVFLAALALASAAVVRIGLRLPVWSLGVIATVVALWGGDVRLTIGYLANLLGLVAVVLGFGLLLIARRDGRSGIPEGVLAIGAGGLAHAGFLPLYLAVAAACFGWLSLRRLVARGRVAIPALPSATRVMVGTASAAFIVAVVVLGVLGFSSAGIIETAGLSSSFRSRLFERFEWIGPAATGVLFVVGVVVIRLRRRAETDGAVVALGLAWLVVALGGILATFVVVTIPGHRILTATPPIPVVMGVGLAGTCAGIWTRVNRLLGGRRLAGILSAAAVGVVLVAAMTWVAMSGLGTIARLAVHRADRGEVPGRMVAGWAQAALPEGLVVVSHPATPRAALAWKGRTNVMRAYVPESLIPNTFFALADTDGTIVGPTTPPEPGQNEVFRDMALLSWQQAASALSAGAAIVAPHDYFGGRAWRGLVDRFGLAAKDFVVIRGPRAVFTPSTLSVRISSSSAGIRGLLAFMVAVAVGGGYGLGWARSRGGTIIDGLALAPAAGLVLLTVSSVAAGIAGIGSAGRVGLAIAVAAAGWFAHSTGGRGRRAPV